MRNFLSFSLPIVLTLTSVSAENPVLGHGSAKYSVDLNWAKADPKIAPVINAHAMVEGRDGLIYVVTDHPQNAFLVFKKDGTFVRAFGRGLEGGHGVEIFEDKGEEFLIHVDCGWHFEAEGWKPSAGNGRVTILKTDGTIVRKLPTPQELGLSKPGPQKFMPCDVAVTAEKTILIADGYASDIIYELTLTGEFVREWGGHADGKPSDLRNAHGISLDTSNPARTLVWVPSRSNNQLKAFTLSGEYVETLELPGAFAGQLFFRGDRIYTAVCWSKENGTGKKLDQSGFIIVMDRATHKVISAPGGNEPVYTDGKLQPLYQTSKTFLHGHDLYVDSDGAIYLGEWNANRRYPAKLTPVK
jgi:DNA-binding beta-propeller fold protein YncE